jgi:BTB/POZ domain
MGSNIAEGLYTFKISDVSKLVHDHGRENKRLCDANSFDNMYRLKSMPFMTDVIEWEIRVYPIGDDLKLYLRLLDNNGAVIRKYGFMNLLHDNCKNGSWMIGTNTESGHEVPFEPDGLVNKLGLPMVELGYFDKRSQKQLSKDDCINMKLAVWFILDSKWKPGRNTGPPDLISELRTGKFPDIHFEVQGQRFPAHMAVIAARVPSMRSDLQNLENRRRERKIEPVMPLRLMTKQSFKYWLEFIYTDSLPPNLEKEIYIGLFNAARTYGMKKLMNICETKFSKSEIESIRIKFNAINLNSCQASGSRA